MSAAPLTLTAPTVAPIGPGRRLIWAVGDTLTMAKRNLIAWIRVPAYIVFTVVQPIMFTLLFRYVFGGAIKLGNEHIPGGYVSYLMPGIIGQTAAFACIGTAISLAMEIRKGAIDRFKSMPMARSALIAGRLLADTLRMLLTILILVGVGYAVGFRFHNGAGNAVLMVLLSAGFGLVMCCVSSFIGLAVKDEESVQAFGLIWLFPLTFLSSAFVAVATMPSWLRPFANNQPVTMFINTIRALALGNQPILHDFWVTCAWLVGILAVFGPLAVWTYRRG